MLLEQKFINLAPLRWKGTEDECYLEGGWVTDYPEIVSWMRVSYWKHNKYQWIEKGKDLGFIAPWDATEANRKPNNAEEVLTQEKEPASNTEVDKHDLDASGLLSHVAGSTSVPNVGGGWMDVVISRPGARN